MAKNRKLLDLVACVASLASWFLLAPIARLFSPGYSHCRHCGFPWNCVNHHVTTYTEGRGMFPLCETCWSKLTVEERIPYYVQLWEEWNRKDLPGLTVEDIRAAVIAEAELKEAR